MQGKHFLITALVGLAAFVGGFLLANNLNRSETNRLRSEIETSKNTAPATSGSQTGVLLSDEEIDAKIAEADSNPENLQFQKGLGVALYRYGAMRQDVAVIDKALKILERAHQLDPKDPELLTTLGNAHFDIGYFGKDNDAFARARGFYEAALTSRPDNVELITDLALTYYLQQPPDLEKAASQFERSLAKDPKHEKTLQFYIQTLIKQNKKEKASEELARLREANPKNPSLAELTELVNDAQVR